MKSEQESASLIFVMTIGGALQAGRVEAFYASVMRKLQLGIKNGLVRERRDTTGRSTKTMR